MVKTKFLIGAFLVKENEVFLIKNDENKWDLPITVLDSGKNIIKDLKDDMKQLLGVSVEPEAVVGIYEDRNKDMELEQIRIFFKVKYKGKIKTKNKHNWFFVDEISEMKPEDTGSILTPVDDYRLGKFFPLDFIEKFKGL